MALRNPLAIGVDITEGDPWWTCICEAFQEVFNKADPTMGALPEMPVIEMTATLNGIERRFRLAQEVEVDWSKFDASVFYTKWVEVSDAK
ncbi:hypothetical protein SEA_VASUNZINGA_6 [Mycobacterium phage VasuNzinga]|uniref:Uncharacterized protein n=1 Tax=Mycobacterium phage VasuNzinga TaxID=2301620 RepID=A0A385UHJ6_9CAUD|nr:hypothetical protein SEA_VASUNZINGA_6 [Mycobacterium phage VasuNzinga]